MKEKLLNELVKGVRVNDYVIKALKVSRGRFREENNFVIGLVIDDNVNELLHLKVFYGRQPYYKPWIEVFNIKPSISIGKVKISYFDSIIEDRILRILSSTIEPGERLFIEYYNDYETLKALEYGVVPVATRLGFKLFNLGFTWFKDWYFPEGFMEGNPKLQCEKPLNKHLMYQNLRNLQKEIILFIEKYSSTSLSRNTVISRSLRRAKLVLDKIKGILS